MLLDPHTGPDGHLYVTRAQAAHLKGVTPAAIGGWIRRGYLKPVPGSTPRRQLFRLDDVDAAEAAAYEAALRTSGSDKRVERRLTA